ncbi:MAG: DUF512 domain-containing protein [Coriobacteriia bacterium]|nr:DUF512 domain-containing protein [Coriobacteriia bacterium]
MRESLRGGTVTAVGPGAAERAGLRPGDIVTAVDGVPVRDIIDWWWSTDAAAFTVNARRGPAEISFTVERTPGEPLGVTFADRLFDGVRECENACVFCFIAGLPSGMRPALYVRDDDYRLSFLSGNFVTLTNVDSTDIDRIIEQRLSPLHVSVHAVDADVRARLICPAAGDSALEVLDELLGGGIQAHVQIVLVPGINDGSVLDETLSYLYERPGILSVGVVPMGYTAHQSRWMFSYDAGGSAEVLELIDEWQDRARTERGVGWVYAADEFYFLAGKNVPSASAYDDFPQYENGIGMASAFRAEFDPSACGTRGAITLVTGEMFAPFLSRLLADRGCGGVRVLPVRNSVLGGNVSVTGLLAGADIIAAIGNDGGQGTYLVPDVVVNSDGLLLDDVPADRLAELARAEVRIVGSDAGSLADALKPDEGRAL